MSVERDITPGGDGEPGSYERAVAEAVERALVEDLGDTGDITAALVPEEATARFVLRARHAGVLAGRDCAAEVFRRVGPDLRLVWHAADGAELKPGDTVMEVSGALRPILTAERTALNFLGRLSGIATLTAQFVAAAREGNPSVQVLDTRKTTPGLRTLEKAAVRAGGGRTTAPASTTPSWSRTTTWPGSGSPKRSSGRASSGPAG